MFTKSAVKYQSSFLEYKQSLSTSQFGRFTLNILFSLSLHCIFPRKLEIWPCDVPNAFCKVSRRKSTLHPASKEVLSSEVLLLPLTEFQVCRNGNFWHLGIFFGFYPQEFKAVFFYLKNTLWTCVSNGSKEVFEAAKL